VKKELDDHNIIEKALDSFPKYDIVVTGMATKHSIFLKFFTEFVNVKYLGHSLGAAVAVLLGFYMRSSYPNLKVYAFSTPGNTKSRFEKFV